MIKLLFYFRELIQLLYSVLLVDSILKDFPAGPTFDENNFVCAHRTVTGRQDPCGHLTETL